MTAQNKENLIPKTPVIKKLKFFVHKLLPNLILFYARALWWYIYARPVEEEMNKLKEEKGLTHDKI